MVLDNIVQFLSQAHTLDAHKTSAARQESTIRNLQFPSLSPISSWYPNSPHFNHDTPYSTFATASLATAALYARGDGNVVVSTIPVTETTSTTIYETTLTGEEATTTTITFSTTTTETDGSTFTFTETETDKLPGCLF